MMDLVTSLCFSKNKGCEPQTWPFPNPNSALVGNFTPDQDVLVRNLCGRRCHPVLDRLPVRSSGTEDFGVKAPSDTCGRDFGLGLAGTKSENSKGIFNIWGNGVFLRRFANETSNPPAKWVASMEMRCLRKVW